MWFREQGHVFDWGTLKWCQAYDHAAERLLRRREHRARRVRSCRGPRPSRQLRQRLGLRRRRRPDLLADEAAAPAGTSTSSGAATSPGSRSSTTSSWHRHKYSTCLDLSTVLTIAASSTQIVVGGSTTLTATLKVVDSDAYGRLGGNAVSGRTVTLQRRAVGTTTWISVGDDAVRVRHRHLRARPAAGRRDRVPSRLLDAVDEGINGDSSPAVRVNVVRLHRRRRREVGVVDPGPMRLTLKGVAPMSRSTAPTARRSRSLAIALLAGACAGASPSGSAAPSVGRRPLPPRDAIGDRHRPAPVAVGRPRRCRPRSRRPRRSRSRAATRSPASWVRSPGATAARTARGCPGSPITVGTGERLTVALAGRRRRWPPGPPNGSPPGATGGAGAIGLGTGGPPIAFDAPEAGSWSVQVTVDFDGGLGSATYYWLVTVR